MRTALLALALVLQAQESPEALLRKLGSESLAERDGAERALRALGTSALPLLDAAAKDADGEVVVRAARVARTIRLLADVPPELLQRLPHATDRLLFGGDAAWAALLLETLDSAEENSEDLSTAIPEIRFLLPRALRHSLSLEELDRILAVLHIRWFDDLAPAFLPWLTHPDEEFREATCEALMNLGSPALVPPLLKLLPGADPPVRENFVRILAELEHPDSVRACLGLLRDPAPMIRHLALEGLGGCPGRAVRISVEACLEDPDLEVLCHAVSTLASLGARDSVPRFVKLLQSGEPDVRWAAVEALGKLHATGSEASLLPLLNDPEESVRRAAVDTLAAFGSPTVDAPLIRMLEGSAGDARYAADLLLRHELKEAGPLLLKWLGRSDDDGSRGCFQRALLRCAGPELLLELRRVVADPDHAGQELAVEVLARAGGDEAIPDLLRLLDSPRPALRSHALAALTPTAAAKASDRLVALLADPDPGVRDLAAKNLASLRRPEDRPRLIALLDDPDENVSDGALQRCREFGFREALPRLWTLIDRLLESPFRRQVFQLAAEFAGPGDAADFARRVATHSYVVEATEALVEFGAPADVVAQVIKTLDGDDLSLESCLILQMASSGRDAALRRMETLMTSKRAWYRAGAAEIAKKTRPWPLVPRLLTLLEDRVDEVRDKAFTALISMGTERLIPACLRISKAGSPEQRAHAVLTLIKLDAREAAPELLPLIDHPDPRVSLAALHAVGRFGHAGALPGLRAYLRTCRSNERPEAVELLGSLHAPEAAPDFLEALDDPKDEVRSASLNALADLRHAPALPRVLEALEDPASDVRKAAVQALRRLGGPPQIPLLVERLHDPDHKLALAAAESLLTLDPERGRAAILDLMASGSSDARCAALRAAADSGDPLLIERALACIQDPDAGLRLAAVRTAGRLHVRSALPGILRGLESTDNVYDCLALDALQAIGDPAAVPALRKLLASSPWNSIRREAAEALVRCGEADGVPLLLHDPVRQGSLNALRRPALWRRLNELSVARRPEGRLHSDLRSLARAAGLTLDLSADAALLDIRIPRREEGPERWFWTDELASICTSELIPILEEGSLRILSRQEGRAFWEAWWDSNRPR